MFERGAWFVGLLVLASCSTSSPPATPSDAAAPVEAGAADAASDAPDFGAPSDVYPAFTPAMPQARNPAAAPVLRDLIVVPVLFAGDPQAAVIADFLPRYAASAEWSAQVGEYGVGTMTVAAPAQLAETPPARIADGDIDPWLRAHLDGTGALGPNDPATLAKTVFVLLYPTGTTITRDGFSSCSGFIGYHTASLGGAGVDAGAGDGGLAPGVPLMMAVIPRCTRAPLNEADTLTEAIAHEVMEAATDPLLDTPLGTAYNALDDDHEIFAIGMGGHEIADLCQVPGSVWTPPSVGHAIARGWSNASANAKRDPCVPSPPDEPYFNAFIDPVDTVTAGTLKTKGITVPAGATRTFDVMLFSDRATSGPFDVSVRELKTSPGAANVLTLTLDRSSGSNGEKVHVTVHASGDTPNHTSAIAIVSKLGAKETVWFTAVGLR